MINFQSFDRSGDRFTRLGRISDYPKIPATKFLIGIDGSAPTLCCRYLDLRAFIVPFHFQNQCSKFVSASRQRSFLDSRAYS